MEIIKKKICLEDFISRIPALIETVDTGKGITTLTEGSWGKIPNYITFLGKTVKYKTFMNLYYSLLNVVVYSDYYEYDYIGNKWIAIDYDWRKSFIDRENITYVDEFPTDYDVDRGIIGITTSEGVYTFYELTKEISAYDGFTLIIDMSNLIGRQIVPLTYRCKECDEIKMASHVNQEIKECDSCGSTNIELIPQGSKVPYFIYVSKLDENIALLEKLKKNAELVCCEKDIYERYGGDLFLNYLYDLKDKEWEISTSIGISPTLDIPLLLTTDLLDLGQYKTYDVDDIDEESGDVIEDKPQYEYSPTIVQTSNESQFRTLRKRKRSVDDNGNELPGILENETFKINIPYQEGYIKNTQILNDVIYADTIISMKETSDAIEQNGNYYESLKNLIILEECKNCNIKGNVTGKLADEENNIYDFNGEIRGSIKVVQEGEKIMKYAINAILNGDISNGEDVVKKTTFNLNNFITTLTIDENNKVVIYVRQFITTQDNENYDFKGDINCDVETIKFCEGTIETPISSVGKTLVNPDIIKIGDVKMDYLNAYGAYMDDLNSRLDSLRSILTKYLTRNYPHPLCLKQEYSYIYEITYESDDMYEDENGNFISITKTETKEHIGEMYVTFNNVQMEVVYVIGGRMKDKNGVLSIDEKSPFELSEDEYEAWDGKGIWYKESFPVKKLKANIFKIDDKDVTFVYDEIDFAAKEITYEFEGIDFPRKNYILCENIMYKSETYHNDSTTDFVFKDEKMAGLNFPLKEDYSDVSFDRGTSSAFERHFQLSELKTWEDLENYRNGMFLNK